MRLIALILILMTVGCVSSPSLTQKSIEYGQVRMLSVGHSTEDDVIKALGTPTKKVEENGHYTLHYNDPKTGFQRLSMNFTASDKKLKVILWMPREHEIEHSLSGAKAGFKDTSFKEVPENIHNPHAYRLGAVFLIDEKAGVTIRYDKDQKAVEGIAIYSPNGRIPAEENKRVQIPYTIDDELN